MADVGEGEKFSLEDRPTEQRVPIDNAIDNTSQGLYKYITAPNRAARPDKGHTLNFTGVPPLPQGAKLETSAEFAVAHYNASEIELLDATTTTTSTFRRHLYEASMLMLQQRPNEARAVIEAMHGLTGEQEAVVYAFRINAKITPVSEAVMQQMLDRVRAEAGSAAAGKVLTAFWINPGLQPESETVMQEVFDRAMDEARKAAARKALTPFWINAGFPPESEAVMRTELERVISEAGNAAAGTALTAFRINAGYEPVSEAVMQEALDRAMDETGNGAAFTAFRINVGLEPVSEAVMQEVLDRVVAEAREAAVTKAFTTMLDAAVAYYHYEGDTGRCLCYIARLLPIILREMHTFLVCIRLVQIKCLAQELRLAEQSRTELRSKLLCDERVTEINEDIRNVSNRIDGLIKELRVAKGVVEAEIRAGLILPYLLERIWASLPECLPLLFNTAVTPDSGRIRDETQFATVIACFLQWGQEITEADVYIDSEIEPVAYRSCKRLACQAFQQSNFRSAKTYFSRLLELLPQIELAALEKVVIQLALEECCWQIAQGAEGEARRNEETERARHRDLAKLEAAKLKAMGILLPKNLADSLQFSASR